MIELLAGLCVFLALASASIWLLAPPRHEPSPDDRLRGLRPSQDQPAEGHQQFGRSSLQSSIPMVRRRLSNSTWAGRTASDLRQADIRLRVSEYVLVRVLTGDMLAAVPAFLLQFHVGGLLLAAICGVVGFQAPAFYLRFARNRRVARIETQLTEFLPALASSLRSGFAFVPAVETVARQTRAPLGDELAAMLNDLSLGADAAAALQDMGERVGSRDLDVVITAVQVQRTTGGNLPEILDAASAALRDRERVRGEVQTFTAQQRMTGIILSVYPIAVGLLLLAIMPSLWTKLFTEPAGQVQLAIALFLQVVGFLAIQRALKIEV